MRRTLLFLAAAVFCAYGLPASAQSGPDEILAQVDDARSPRQDYTITVEVSSFSPKRAPKTAVYEVMVKGPQRTVVKTVKPENERNRILLMRDHDLWAFFPDVAKPLRLSMQERLMGEAANGDIARVDFGGDYDAVLVREENIEGKDYYILQLTAKNKDVTYGKAIVWAEKGTCRPLKAEFYAVSGKLLKTCSYEDYAELGGKERPTKLVMQDPLTKGKYTVIKYHDVKIAELPEKYFAKDYMKKLMD